MSYVSVCVRRFCEQNYAPKKKKKIKYCLPILHAINDRNLRNLPIRTSLPEIFEIELFGIWFGKKEQHTQTQSTNTIFLSRRCDNEQ